ncbi:MAG: zinc-ribbon domain-containing protein [Candidatus Sulfotelmatobacter sp.]
MDAVNPMPISCPHCSAQMPDSAAFCPGCGRPMQTSERAQAKIGMLTENLAGALAYFTFIPATALLLLVPYSKNRFVRFQCLQCLFLTLICLLLGVVLKLASPILFLVPLVGPLFVSLVSIVGALGAFVVWLVLVVKAFQGEIFKLPLLGELAERQANLIPGRQL